MENSCETETIIFQDNLNGFANISQRFYSAVDKNESDETTFWMIKVLKKLVSKKEIWHEEKIEDNADS
mgnify:CR=1 FL=1